MAFRILQEKGFVDKMLVICPLRPMVIVWPEQKDKFHEFSHLKVNVLHGSKKEQALQDDDADIYVVNPEGLPWLFGAKTVNGKLQFDKKRVDFIKKKFPMLVVDESTKFRNTQTARFKLLREFVKFFKRRYILTGSPMPNGLEDLFGQTYILDEGNALGRYITHFRNEYMFPAGFGGYEWKAQPGAKERILEKIAPLVQVVERSNDDPELLVNDIFVDLDPKARRLYESMEEDMVAEVEEGKVVAANAAVASSKCRQICNGAVYGADGKWEEVHDSKIEALSDLIEQLQGDPLLVTYEFEFDRARLDKTLKIPCISTGNVQKDKLTIQKFARGELPVVMGNPASIALGTDGLQESCSNIAMVGVTWKYLDYEQVIDRVRRQGNSAATVTVHRILARDTVDERVLKVIDKRDKTQADFLSALKPLGHS
jgi:SNF2 family DNA or RNA helicase